MLRNKHTAYLYSMASVSMMLIGLFSYGEPLTVENVQRAAVRVASIVTGVVISAVVSSTVLPVHASTLAAQQLANALDKTAGVLREVTALYTGSPAAPEDHSFSSLPMPLASAPGSPTEGVSLESSVAEDVAAGPHAHAHAHAALDTTLLLPHSTARSQALRSPSRAARAHRDAKSRAKLTRSFSAFERAPVVGTLWDRLEKAQAEIGAARAYGLQTRTEIYAPRGGLRFWRLRRRPFPMMEFERLLDEATALIHCTSSAVWGAEEAALPGLNPAPLGLGVRALQGIPGLAESAVELGVLLEGCIRMSAQLVLGRHPHPGPVSGVPRPDDLLAHLSLVAHRLLQTFDDLSEQLDERDDFEPETVEVLGQLMGLVSGLSSLTRGVLGAAMNFGSSMTMSTEAAEA